MDEILCLFLICINKQIAEHIYFVYISKNNPKTGITISIFQRKKLRKIKEQPKAKEIITGRIKILTQI